MRLAGVTAHSADSMRSRFRRLLVPRLIERLRATGLPPAELEQLTTTNLRQLTPSDAESDASQEYTIDENSMRTGVCVCVRLSFLWPPNSECRGNWIELSFEMDYTVQTTFPEDTVMSINHNSVL